MENKGISLIVLIITIVVIIILATAIIVNIVETNIIGNANEAVVKQDIKTFQDELDLYIADQYVRLFENYDASTLNASTVEEVIEIIPSIKNSKYEEYVTIANGKIVIKSTMQEPQRTWAMEALNEGKYESIAVNTIVEGSNATINGYNPTYSNPVIPVGFKAIETTAASWSDSDSDGNPDGWNDGLVIQDSDENEYVWIPVDGENVTYTKWNSSFSVAYTVTKEQVKDDTLPSGVVSENYQIIKYGGFYVARYEAGLPDEQTTEELMKTKTFTASDNNRTDIGKAQSKANKIVWNAITYNNAKIVSEDVISTNYVQTGLITGTQWDTMLKWIENIRDNDGNPVYNVASDSTAWGNYKTKYGYTINGYYRPDHATITYTYGEYTKSAVGYLLLTTGGFASSDQITMATPKNLYDVAGNLAEWSAEEVIEKAGNSTAIGNKVRRGGSYYDGYGDLMGPASNRTANYAATVGAHNIGFRFVLYIK